MPPDDDPTTHDHAPDGGLEARDAADGLAPAELASFEFDTLSTLLDRPQLARVYVYVLYWGPTTVPEVVNALGLSESTAYEYVDRLVNHGALDRAAEGRPREIRAEPVVIRDPAAPLVVTPTVIHAVARAATDDAVARFRDRHGLGTLVAVLRGAGLHYAGRATQRSVAADVDAPAPETMAVVAAFAPVLAVGRERDPHFETLFPEAAESMALPDLDGRATVPPTDGTEWG